MNLIGKIFIVLIFVMSLMFATFSIMVYTTHVNWRQEIVRTPSETRGTQQPGYKYQLEQARAESARLNDEISSLNTQLNAEKAAKIQALAKSEATIQALSAEKKTADDQLKAKETELAANTETLRATQANLSNLTGEVKKLRDEVADAQRETDEQIKKATSLTDKLAIATGQLAVLKERNEQLAIDVTKAKQLLPKGVTLEMPIDASTVKVSGQIAAVSRTKVELSIGSDDGVRVGQDLDIYRGDKYVGRVKIIDVRPDNSVGSILTEYQQLPIQRGDNVASNLK